MVTFVKSDLPTVAAEEGLTVLWPTKDSVGHVGSLHNEVAESLVVAVLSHCDLLN